MALTIVNVRGTEGELGRVRSRIVDVTFDNSYTTGGFAVAPKEVGLGTQVFGAFQLGGNATSGGFKPHWDTTNNKLMAFQTGASAALGTHTHVLHFQTSAAANAVTAAANQLRTPAAAFDVAGVANSAGEGGVVAVTAGSTTAAALAEVGAATDLSLVTVRMLFIGI